MSRSLLAATFVAEAWDEMGHCRVGLTLLGWAGRIPDAGHADFDIRV